MHNQSTIFWYDFESWGISPKYDKLSQFAGIRTDLELNIIGEPIMFYCQPPTDYLPNPEAALVTGITPQKAMAEGLPEAEFSKRIHQEFSQPNTCVAGYNSIRFDDEMTRYLFYRNFYDPYAREWKNGNSRWDIIDMVRACYALRPSGINWPKVINKDTGQERISFKLELLSAANNIAHEAAHDAMSDVYATIAMAKLVKDKQPKLYQFLFELRHKKKVSSHIDVYNMTPIVHTSSRISSEHGCTSWFAPIAHHPTNKNAIIAIDLAKDPTPLFELDAASIKERLYTRHSDLSEGKGPIPIKLIHLNKCPVVAPAKTLLPENAKRLNIPRDTCLMHLEQLKQHREIIDKLNDVYTEKYDNDQIVDAEHALYSGEFFSASDKAQMSILHNTTPEKLAVREFNFQDPRLSILLFRYRARNYPHTLSAEEQLSWQTYCQEKIHSGGKGILSIEEYILKIENLAHQHENDSEKMRVLKALYQYVQ